MLALAASGDGRRYLRERIESSPPSWPSWIEGRVTRNMVLDIGWDAMIVADPRSSAFERRRGETVAAISAALGRDPFDVYFDLVESSQGQAQFVNVGYGGDLEDDGPMQRMLARPDAIPETDTVPVPAANGGVHVSLPLFYGSMARFIGRYSRDLGLVPLEQAVARITRVPAERVRLQDRGLLRAGRLRRRHGVRSGGDRRARHDARARARRWDSLRLRERRAGRPRRCLRPGQARRPRPAARALTRRGRRAGAAAPARTRLR